MYSFRALSCTWKYLSYNVLLFYSDFSVSCEEYKIDGKEWYHYFLCGYKVYVVVNFLSQVIFVFLLFLGMVMYANEVETKEK